MFSYAMKRMVDDHSVQRDAAAEQAKSPGSDSTSDHEWIMVSPTKRTNSAAPTSMKEESSSDSGLEVKPEPARSGFQASPPEPQKRKTKALIERERAHEALMESKSAGEMQSQEAKPKRPSLASTFDMRHLLDVVEANDKRYLEEASKGNARSPMPHSENPPRLRVIDLRVIGTAGALENLEKADLDRIDGLPVKPLQEPPRPRRTRKSVGGMIKATTHKSVTVRFPRQLLKGSDSQDSDEDDDFLFTVWSERMREKLERRRLRDPDNDPERGWIDKYYLDRLDGCPAKSFTKKPRHSRTRKIMAGPFRSTPHKPELLILPDHEGKGSDSDCSESDICDCWVEKAERMRFLAEEDQRN
jgi:hypothetical protein